jgi:hypothetical protein
VWAVDEAKPAQGARHLDKLLGSCAGRDLLGDCFLRRFDRPLSAFQ